MEIGKILQYNNIRQGSWVKVNDVVGVYILAISNRQSIIACYIKNKPKYMTIKSTDIIKIGKLTDYRLFKFAKKHVLWTNRGK